MANAKDVVKFVRGGINDKTSAARLAEIVGALRRNRITKGLTPERLVALLEDLGPTFIKLGQILSARSDMLPQQYCDALKTLRSSTTPEPFEAIERRLRLVYGRDYHEVFSEISKTPLGSASVAQVHKARLRVLESESNETFADTSEGEALESEKEASDTCGDTSDNEEEASDTCGDTSEGEEEASAPKPDLQNSTLSSGDVVAVKIRRDHVREDMLRDIQLMRRAADLMNLAGASRISGVDIVTVINEFDRVVREEIDFNAERENLLRLARDSVGNPGVTCPKVYPDLSNEAILVMEFVEGLSLEDPRALCEMGYDLREIGDRIADAYMRQMVEHGFFHADPHAANIIVRPALTSEERAEGKRDRGEIVWIDCGIMGELSPHERSLFYDMMKAMVLQDGHALTDLFIEWGRVSDTPGKKLNYGKLLQELTTLVNRYSAEDASSMDIVQLLNDIMSILDEASVIMPQSFVTIVRGLASLQGTLITLTPEISILAVVQRYVKSYMSRTFDPVKETEVRLIAATGAADKALQIPEHLVNVLDMAEKGRLKLGFDLTEANQPMDTLGHIIDRLSLAIITAGLFIGSSFIYAAGMEPQLLGVPIVGFMGYLGAAVLSLYIIFKIRKRS